jgi:hypothetical protein
MVLFAHLALSDIALGLAIYSVGVVSGVAATRLLFHRSK